MVNGNERWKARASAQIESRAGQLSGERAAIARERQALSDERGGLAQLQAAHAASVSAERHRRGALVAIAAFEQCMITQLCRALLRWRGATVAVDCHRKTAELASRLAHKEAAVQHLEGRPLGLQGAAAEERRLRMLAEEAAAALEHKIAVLQRQSSAAPAKVARADLAISLQQQAAREERRVAADAHASLSRLCKLAAVAAYLRSLRRHRLGRALRDWAAIVGSLEHAASLTAATRDAERRGYTRALEAALKAERAAAVAGKGAEAEREAETRREAASARAEAQASEEARATESAAAQATRLSLEARLRRAEEAVAEQTSRRRRGEEHNAKLSAALQSAQAKAEVAVATANTEAAAAEAARAALATASDRGGKALAASVAAATTAAATSAASASAALELATAAAAAAADAANGPGGGGGGEHGGVAEAGGTAGSSAGGGLGADRLLHEAKLAEKLEAAMGTARAATLQTTTQRKALAAARAVAALAAAQRAACLSALSGWRRAAVSLEGLSILAPLRRQLRGTSALAETRAINARSALAAVRPIAFWSPSDHILVAFWLPPDCLLIASDQLWQQCTASVFSSCAHMATASGAFPAALTTVCGASPRICCDCGRRRSSPSRRRPSTTKLS